MTVGGLTGGLNHATQQELPPMALHGRVLIVAGSDSGAGAGIQADIKTVQSLGGYATTAITALTAQNTLGVHGMHPVPPDFVALQMSCVLADIGADAVKTGMLCNAGVIAAVCAVLEAQRQRLPLVLDPVMLSKGGTKLIDGKAIGLLVERLLPLATLLTPNLPEASVLVGFDVENESQMHRAADRLMEMGARAVLLKGGHLEGDELLDLLATPHDSALIRSRRIPTKHTHGTGCTLASAIATGLAQRLGLLESVGRASRFVRAAIENAPGFGAGHGPMDHSVRV